MNATALPDTLSGTLTLAIHDALALDRSTYMPHSGYWHGYNSDFPDVCLVCLAGSVIARSFGENSKLPTNPFNYPNAIGRKLRSVNLCRLGDYLSACRMFHDQAFPVSIEQRLIRLARPVHFAFIGWDEFTSHLYSIEAVLPDLRKIEADALENLSNRPGNSD